MQGKYLSSQMGNGFCVGSERSSWGHKKRIKNCGLEYGNLKRGTRLVVLQSACLRLAFQARLILMFDLQPTLD